MSSTNEQAPIRERWTAQTATDGDEAVAGALLRLAAEPCPLGEGKLAEIQARIRWSERVRARATAHPGRRLLRQLAVATSFLLFGGAISASVFQVLRKAPASPPRDTEAAPAKPGRHSSAKAARPRPAALAQMPEEPTQSLPEPPTPATLPSSAVRLPHSSRSIAFKEPRDLPRTDPTPLAPDPSLAPPAGPSPLARESRLLASAISKLRQDGDPEGALGILDQHRAEFGEGALAPEATATRIEALLRLGRNSQALVLLDAQRLSPRGLGREMLAARAELRADKGRCSAALQDFDQLLSVAGKTDKATERALYGRATCRAKSGDRAGARQDLERYIEDFPQGRFIEQARAFVAAWGAKLR
jgi:hypothetical protein